jgi:hypothetical protein
MLLHCFRRAGSGFHALGSGDEAANAVPALRRSPPRRPSHQSPGRRGAVPPSHASSFEEGRTIRCLGWSPIGCAATGAKNLKQRHAGQGTLLGTFSPTTVTQQPSLRGGCTRGPRSPGRFQAACSFQSAWRWGARSAAVSGCTAARRRPHEPVRSLPPFPWPREPHGPTIPLSRASSTTSLSPNRTPSQAPTLASLLQDVLLPNLPPREQQLVHWRHLARQAPNGGGAGGAGAGAGVEARAWVGAGWW